LAEVREIRRREDDREPAHLLVRYFLTRAQMKAEKMSTIGLGPTECIPDTEMYWIRSDCVEGKH
jgi:hypothetical protein